MLRQLAAPQHPHDVKQTTRKIFLLQCWSACSDMLSIRSYLALLYLHILAPQLATTSFGISLYQHQYHFAQNQENGPSSTRWEKILIVTVILFDFSSDTARHMVLPAGCLFFRRFRVGIGTVKNVFRTRHTTQLHLTIAFVFDKFFTKRQTKASILPSSPSRIEKMGTKNQEDIFSSAYWSL